MDQTKSILDKLNMYSCEPQRKLPLRNMEVNKKYEIISAHRHNKIKSGKSVVKPCLDNCYIYLPVRFNILPDYFLEQINNNRNYRIQNCGRWRKTFKLVFSNSAESKTDIVHIFNEYQFYNPSYNNNE